MAAQMCAQCLTCTGKLLENTAQMFEELEAIANLKFGKLVDSIAEETQEKLVEYNRKATARGSVLGGFAESERVRIRLDGAERKCRGLSEIWLQLIIKKNGRLTQEDLQFIMTRVKQCASTTNVTSMSPGGLQLPESALSALKETAERRMQSVVSNVARDLEIRIREHEHFGVEERPSTIAAREMIGPAAGGERHGTYLIPAVDHSASDQLTRVAPDNADRQRRVWVVHGRDERLRSALFTFLRSIGLDPLEFNEARGLTGKPTPYVGEILEVAFEHAQAVVVLLSPDDEARLRPDLTKTDDPPYEKELTGQARPNVLFEGGMALVSHRDRTVLVQVGDVRPFSDIAGKHLLRLDNSTEKRQEFAHRLQDAGCPVKLTGIDWHTAGNFSTVPKSSMHGGGGGGSEPGSRSSSPALAPLEVTLTVEGDPPVQVLKLVANREVRVSRLEYMLSSEATIAAESVLKQGDAVEVPINHDLLTKVWNVPRTDRNEFDHSGPAKLRIMASADGLTRQYVLPVQMESIVKGNTMYRRAIGSKMFLPEQIAETSRVSS